MDIENPQIEIARQLIESTGCNLFLTGKAGTGKTTFLRRLRENSVKRMVVLAPTGIAAINAGGVTIHSFFQLPHTPYLPGLTDSAQTTRHDRFSREKLRIIRTLDLLVIDEISMVRADLLDAVDASLRRHRDPSRPFGGVQLLLIGDLQQLAPVATGEEWQMLSQFYSTPFFFSSTALRATTYTTVELQHVYRQSDSRFLDLLNRVRENTADAEVLDALNRRYIPDFNPADSEGYVRLTTHNRTAADINKQKLDALTTPAVSFQATITGDFPEYSFPTEQNLTLKKGAQVMFIRNDSEKRFYNGMMGVVESIEGDNITVRAHSDGRLITTTPIIWENVKYTVDKQSANITTEVQGTFTQIPLKLAWAITIHKSQGLTFDKAIIDAAASFAHGQTYVALSRCRTLEGMVLSAPLPAHAIISNADVEQFNRDHFGHEPTPSMIELMQHEYLMTCIDDLFGADRLTIAFSALKRLVDEYLYKSYPALAKAYAESETMLAVEVEKVARAFAGQYRRIADSAQLMGRLLDGAKYFSERFKSLLQLVSSTPSDTDNKVLTTRLQTALAAISDILLIKLQMLANLSADHQLTATYLLELRAKAVLNTDSASARRKVINNLNPRTKDSVASDISNQQLFEALKAWRLDRANGLGVPCFTIFSNADLIGITNALPRNEKELLEVKGVGKKKVKSFGCEVLNIVAEYTAPSDDSTLFN